MMTNEWIIDVLADLSPFANENGLTALAMQLDDAALVAKAEISTLEGVGQELAKWEVGNTGRVHRAIAAR